MTSFDYVVAGGGLQAGVLVLAIRSRQPEAAIAVVERGASLGGNHTWCFHHADVPASCRGWLEPLVSWRWDGYSVHFPGQVTHLDEPYAGVSSARFHDVVSRALREHAGSALFLSTEVARVEADRVVLGDGRELRAAAVIDARGAQRGEDSDRMRAGYQKFVGIEVELEEPHRLDRPVLMDATVDQREGFRFFYLLPFDERTLLVEDTRFHDSPRLDVEAFEAEVRAYVERRGWIVARELRTESGVLPMPWKHRIAASMKPPLRAGYRGGWFHPGTGYSFPVAVRLADFVAARPADELFGPDLDRFSRAHRKQARFPRFLNRLLFRWYPPASRHPIFARVYRLPRSVLRNFYALRLTWSDRVRLLVGRPPPGISLRHRLSHSEP